MIQLLAGDCREVLRTLPANSVHTCVTSPPYYGLRDYGTAQWDGGDAGCEHMQRAGQRQDVGRVAVDGFHGSSLMSELKAKPYVGECGKCGARRIDRQIGLEATPDAFIATLVAVFREVRRVLRPDGTLWLNMGDSFSSGNSGQRVRDTNGGFRDGLDTRLQGAAMANPGRAATAGLAPKQLLMMPARVALALQADGWWVRSEIVWAKPNPMPESCRDRPTSAHEKVYLLSKRARYFYDADAVREPVEEPWRSTGRLEQGGSKDVVAGVNRGFGLDGLRPRLYNPAGRNLRNVWSIATEAFSAAHFATFPTALAERCIRAGTSERGCCAACGAPWVRVTENGGYVLASNTAPAPNKGHLNVFGERASGMTAGGFIPGRRMITTTTGWRAGCQCNAEVVPCTVLDPFAGASTTLLVAQRLQRNAIGIELNPEYIQMSEERIRSDAGLFADFGDPVSPDDVRSDDLPENEALGFPDHRSTYPDHGDAQPSLWEWDHALLPT